MIEKVYDPDALGLNIVKRSGKELLCRCPRHEDNKPSATYNVQKGLLYCFSCKATINARQLAKELGGELVEVNEGSVRQRQFGNDTSWLDLLKNPIAYSQEAMTYLEGRKVTVEQVKKYQIREAGNGIIFPLRDRFGVDVGCLTRNYSSSPRYIFSGERPVVWPFSNLAHGEPTYIVEGTFGVLRFEAMGFKAVASMGTGYAQQIVRLLKNSTTNPIGFFDPDYAGRLASGKLVLMGVPVAINDTCADEVDWLQQVNDCQVTYDVMEVINAFDGDRDKLYKALEAFWRTL